jgi:hypothetical protein
MKQSLAFLLFVISQTYGCETDIDCSLNGKCGANNACVCDKPWKGDNCDIMSFLPVDMPQGYGQDPQLVSWGGGVLYDTQESLYHLYVSAMTNGCPLQDWTTNSRIEHAVSYNITGPYVFQDVAVNTWSHNSAPIQLGDGTYAIVHIGDGSGDADGGYNCTIGSPQLLPDKKESSFLTNKQTLSTTRPRKQNGRGSTIHVSDSLNGKHTKTYKHPHISPLPARSLSIYLINGLCLLLFQLVLYCQ